MAEKEALILIVVLMTVVTYLPRVIPLQINVKHWPNWIQVSLEFLPVTIVSAITIPSVLLNSYSSYFLTAEFFATIFAAAVASYSKNLMVTVLSSLAFYVVIDQYVFG